MENEVIRIINKKFSTIKFNMNNVESILERPLYSKELNVRYVMPLIST